MFYQRSKKEEVRKSIDFLKAYLTKHPFKTFVLGISGGQDSTLRLAQLAMGNARRNRRYVVSIYCDSPSLW